MSPMPRPIEMTRGRVMQSRAPAAGVRRESGRVDRGGGWLFVQKSSSPSSNESCHWDGRKFMFESRSSSAGESSQPSL